MTVKPFHFNLKKISSRQQELLDAIMSFLPKMCMREKFKVGIKEALAKHLGDDVSYRLETVSEIAHGFYSKQLPKNPIVAVLGCVPVDKKAYLEIDSVIAQKVLERLLGGELENKVISRLPTDIEQGVLQYLLLQLMSHVYRLCGKNTRIHFRFDRFIFSAKEMEELMRPEEGVVSLNLIINIGDTSGYAKLVLPNPLVEATFLDLSDSVEAAESDLNEKLEDLKRFDNMRIVMWADAGRTTLTPADLGELERDDVILFDETDVFMSDNKELKGRVVLRVGTGRHGGFLADVSTDKKSLKCRLEQQFKGEEI